MTEKGCDNCYYTYFDEGAYPCSLCIRGVERIDMWQPSKKTKADRKTEPQTDCADTNLSGKPTGSTRSKMEQVETEPQTEIKVEPTWVGTTYGRFEDEPQTDCAWK